MEKRKFSIKKCPYCSVVLGLNDQICFSCKHKVGKVNEYGIAEKPVDWMSYVMCFLAMGGFVFFIWWGFLRDKP